MPNQKRNVHLKSSFTPDEYGVIRKKMGQYGGTNLSAYLRKMALDGYVINLSLPDLQEVSSLLRRAGDDINRIARQADGTNRVSDADLREITENQRRILESMGKVLKALSKLE